MSCPPRLASTCQESPGPLPSLACRAQSLYELGWQVFESLLSTDLGARLAWGPLGHLAILPNFLKSLPVSQSGRTSLHSQPRGAGDASWELAGSRVRPLAPWARWPSAVFSGGRLFRSCARVSTRIVVEW